MSYCIFIALGLFAVLLLLGVPIWWATLWALFLWIVLDAISDASERR